MYNLNVFRADLKLFWGRFETFENGRSEILIIKKTILKGEKLIFDENNFKIMAEQRNPKILLKRLENRCGHKVGIDYHMLRGMKNPSKFCYVISLLQLCFHCDDFVQFIKSNDPENDIETLLKKYVYIFVFKQLKFS